MCQGISGMTPIGLEPTTSTLSILGSQYSQIRLSAINLGIITFICCSLYVVRLFLGYKL